MINIHHIENNDKNVQLKKTIAYNTNQWQTLFLKLHNLMGIGDCI